MSQPFRRTDKDYYKGYLFNKTEKYKYISSTDHVDINSGNQKLLLDGTNNKASVIADNIDLSATTILINAQDEVRIKAGTYTIDADTLNQVYDNYEITVENFEKENNSLDWVSTITGISGEVPVNLQLDNQNNVYITGRSLSNLLTIKQLSLDNNELVIDISYDVSLNGGNNAADNYIIKYKQDGSLNWVSTIEGTNTENIINLQIDNSNNVYITGFTYSNSIKINKGIINNNDELIFDISYDVSLTINNYDTYIIKYNPDGSLNWVSTITGDGNERPVNLQIDNSNNVYITGFTYSNPITINQLSLNNGVLNVDVSYDVSLNGGNNAAYNYIIKYNQDGSLNWVSTIEGTNTENIINLQIDNLNNVYMTGSSNSNSIKINKGYLNNDELIFDISYDVSLTINNYDTYIIKYNPDGSLTWVSTITGTNDEINDALKIDNNNNVYITGYTTTHDLITINQLSLDNNKLVIDISYDVSLNGTNYDNTYLIKYNQDGSLNWVSTIDNGWLTPYLQIDNNNNVYIRGFTYSNSIKINQLSLNNGVLNVDVSYDVSLNDVNDDAFLIKYDQYGSLNWVTTITSSGNDYPVNLQIDNSNNVYITGKSNGNPITINQLSLNDGDLEVVNSYDVSLNMNQDTFLIKMKEYILNPDDKSSFKITNETIEMESNKFILDTSCSSIVLDSSDCNVVIKSDNLIDLSSNNINALANDKITLDTSCSSIVLDGSDCEILIKADNLIDLSSQIINVLAQDKITLDVSSCASIVLDSSDCEILIKADEISLITPFSHPNSNYSKPTDISYEIPGTGYFGRAVALNSKGDRLVVGDYGYKRVYIYNLDDSGDPSVGTPYVIEQGTGGFGYAVALNNAGDRLVVGTTGNRVHIYNLDDSGNPFVDISYEISEIGNFGYAVALNGSGNRLIVGTEGNRTFIYNLDNSGNPFVDISYEIQGTGYYGSSVALNNAGDRLVVGVDKFSSHLVNIYNLDNSGNPFVGTSYVIPGTSGFGYVVALNDKGDRLVVGTEDNRVCIYNLDNSGNPSVGTSYVIPGTTGFGRAVALNGSGDRLVVGTTGNRVHIYKLDNSGNPFVVISYEISGTTGFGYAVALNNAGDRLVVGTQTSPRTYIYNLVNNGEEITYNKNIIIKDKKIDLSSQNINVIAQDKITLDASNCASIVLDSNDCNVVIKADEKIDLSSKNITLDTSSANIVIDGSDGEVLIKADEKIDLSSQNINVFAQDKITLATSSGNIVIDGSDGEVLIKADKITFISNNIITENYNYTHYNKTTDFLHFFNDDHIDISYYKSTTSRQAFYKFIMNSTLYDMLVNTTSTASNYTLNFSQDNELIGNLSNYTIRDVTLPDLYVRILDITLSSNNGEVPKLYEIKIIKGNNSNTIKISKYY